MESKSVCFHGTPRGTQRFLFGPTLPPAECKYQFQAWGDCDLNTALKTRTGSLKRALHNADCQKTVTISKPCGKLTKSKPQGRFLSLNHNFNLNGLKGSGRIFRCANFPQGNLGWITLRKGLEKVRILSTTPVLFSSRQLRSSDCSPLCWWGYRNSLLAETNNLARQAN